MRELTITELDAVAGGTPNGPPKMGGSNNNNSFLALFSGNGNFATAFGQSSAGNSNGSIGSPTTSVPTFINNNVSTGQQEYA